MSIKIENRNQSQGQSQKQEKAHVAAMSGQEVWFLLDKGYQPLGLVSGSCDFSMGALTTIVTTIKGGVPGEVKGFAEAMYQARALAFSRMQFMADELGADGIIVNYINMEYTRGHLLVEFVVRGTAVRYVGSDGKKLPSKHGHVVIVVK
jgi:uncharacterized protein YbjQ (UPF0145 family)